MRLAAVTGPVLTPGGIVQAEAEDALVTGVDGERWPVSSNAFDQKYRALAPTRHGA